MNNHLLLAFCFVLFWSGDVRCEIENEVRRGVFPFMAILYYPDESVVDATGIRFQRGAVLIKPDWLVSGSIDNGVQDNASLGFPLKTLLARMGALTIDLNFTLNEDEDEEEREVIQIVKPSGHSLEVWWFTDITVLKTLLPFKQNQVIAPTAISQKRAYVDKSCSILVYAKKYGNFTEDKVLMQLGVELLTASEENCGHQFLQSTMTCAVPSDDMKASTYDPEFCHGNSGGPLICEGEVIGLQTYIKNNCKQPHLFQLLASWDTFINCSIEQKCNVDLACNMCTAIHKDPTTNIPVTTSVFIATTIETEKEINLVAQAPLRTEFSPTLSTDSSSTDQISVEQAESTTTEETELPASSGSQPTELLTTEQNESPATDSNESINMEKTESISSEQTESPSSKETFNNTLKQTEFPASQQTIPPELEQSETTSLKETIIPASTNESNESSTPQRLVDFLNYMNEDSISSKANNETNAQSQMTTQSSTLWPKVNFVSPMEDEVTRSTRVEAQIKERPAPVVMVAKRSGASRLVVVDGIQSSLLLIIIAFII